MFISSTIIIVAVLVFLVKDVGFVCLGSVCCWWCCRWFSL